MSSPPLYTSIPSTDPSEPQPQSFSSFQVDNEDEIETLRSTITFPFYPLLILLSHFLIALRLIPLSDTNSLLLFIFFSITVFLLHDRLVLVLGHPKTKLEFLKQRWIASNTQLAGVLVAGGFLVVPRDGKWSDARGFLVFFGVVAMIGMVIFVNVSHDQASDRERARLNPSAVVETPVVADLAEQGVENEEVTAGGSSSLADLEAQLEGRSK